MSDYDPLEAVTSRKVLWLQGTPQLHPDGNIHSHITIQNGDIEKGFERRIILRIHSIPLGKCTHF